MRNIRADEQREGKSRDSRVIERRSQGVAENWAVQLGIYRYVVYYTLVNACVCGYVVHCVEHVQYKGYK